MNPEQEFFELCINIYRPYTGEANKILSAYDLSSAQWQILKDIARHGETTLVDVSRRRQIEKSTANKVITYLLELDLIESTPGTDDRRRKNLSMSASGERLFKEVRARMADMQREILQDFDSKEVDMMIKMLRRINI
ncbi:MarR family winged helix-turn-helix transcriptional regulator [Salinicoccus siamensis]|uniref:MarR family winged helix-turn-helix transcriptional regulator n=1 Tax=Salinicoccus siamensis TaxID=381830 RepID=A0ABV5Z8G1_9STAP